MSCRLIAARCVHACAALVEQCVNTREWKPVLSQLLIPLVEVTKSQPYYHTSPHLSLCDFHAPQVSCSAPYLTVYFCNSNDVAPISNSFRFCLSLFGSVCCFVCFAAAQGDRADCSMFKLLSLAGYGAGPPWVRIG